MGMDAERARSSLRFSLGIYNTDEEVDYLLACLPGMIQKLRSFAVS
jgi:cysteine desulfurase